jgi:hypothetical protein
MNRVGCVAKRRAVLAIGTSNGKPARVEEAKKTTVKKAFRRPKKQRAKSGKR